MLTTKLCALNSRWSKQNINNGGSGSGKANALLNMIKKHDDDYNIDKMYFYVRDPNQSKHQYLIKKREKKNGFGNLKDPKAFIEHSNNM